MLSDLSGQPADRTVAFGVGKARYEINLTSDEAHGLLEALQPYVEVARRVGPGSAPAK
ncbi:Lsr2 dimerization domain-containing protein [Salana multivorans]